MEVYATKKIRFPSADGQRMVTGWIYSPNAEAVGILQLSHGMCEYIGRYEHFIEDLVRNGFVVCGHDHIGHGASSEMEEYGYFGPKDGWTNLVQDLHTMTGIVKESYPGLPCFLFGHSMGSFVSRLYLSSFSYELTGVILCGTGGPNPMAGVGIPVCRLVSMVCGKKHRSKLLDRLAFGAYNKKIQPQRTKQDWLTRDETVVDRYRNDPKCMFLFTAAGYGDLSKLSQKANCSAWYQSLDRNLPMFLISGDMDPVGDYGHGVEQVYDRLKQIGISDVALKLYPGARHELLNETNYDEVLEDILQWIELHLTRKN